MDWSLVFEVQGSSSALRHYRQGGYRQYSSRPWSMYNYCVFMHRPPERLTKVPPVMSKFCAFGNGPKPECWIRWSLAKEQNAWRKQTHQRIWFCIFQFGFHYGTGCRQCSNRHRTRSRSDHLKFMDSLMYVDDGVSIPILLIWSFRSKAHGNASGMNRWNACSRNTTTNRWRGMSGTWYDCRCWRF